MIHSKVNRLDLSGVMKDIQGLTQQSAMLTLMGVKEKWAQEASSRLNTTAKAYTDSLYISFRSSASGIYGEVGLRGSWANMLEEGFPAYDLKNTFAKSTKRKRTKSGDWYLSVPFRHFTPAANKSAGSIMPGSVYREARKMPQWGKMGASPTAQTSASGYEHKTSVYSGMQKVPQSGNKNVYMSWRTVSENSPAASWMHPGFSGVHIQQDLSDSLEDTFMEVFSSIQQDS